MCPQELYRATGSLRRLVFVSDKIGPYNPIPLAELCSIDLICLDLESKKNLSKKLNTFHVDKIK